MPSSRSATPINHVAVFSMITFMLIFVQPSNCLAQTQPLPTWAPDRACLQQFESVGKECQTQLGEKANSIPTLQQCIQGKISHDCKNQMSNAQKHVSQAITPCTEASQQYSQALKATCSNLTKDNENCFKKVTAEHKPKMEVACKGMR